MAKLIIVWNTGEKEEYTYASREEAEEAKRNMEMAFGAQVWCGVV